MSLGTFQVGTTGRPITVSADGNVIVKPIGAKWAWDTVSAATDATTLSDNTPIAVGEKYFRYGSIMVPVSTATVQTATISGSPTGGTFTPSYVIDGKTYTTSALAYNVSAADMKTALNAAFSSNYPQYNENSVLPVDSVGLSTGVYTITFNTHYGSVDEMTGTAALTGGSTPAVAYDVTTAGSADNGSWAQWNGSDSLVRGKVGILNSTIKQWNPSILQGYWDEDMGGLIEGGLVYSERLNVTSDKLATILTAMPLLRFVPAE